MSDESTVMTPIERRKAIAEKAAAMRRPFEPQCPEHLSDSEWLNLSFDLIEAQIEADFDGTPGGSVDLGMFGTRQVSGARSSRCVCCGSEIHKGDPVRWAQLHPEAAEGDNGRKFWVTLREGCYQDQRREEIARRKASANRAVEPPVQLDEKTPKQRRASK